MKLSVSRRSAFIVAAIALVAAFVWVMARSGPLAPIRVTETRVDRADLAPMLVGIGVVEARRGYLLGPTSAARVRRVMVDVGDTVHAGALLAEMDPVDLDQRLAATAAAAARAQNAVDSAAAQVADSGARRDVAAANARRYEDLAGKGFVSSSVAEGKTQELKSAAAQVSAASAALAGAQQDLARLRAEREAAQQQRANLRLLAPVDGVVTARDVEPGSTVVAGQAVLRLIAPDSLWVRLRLDQNRSAGLQVGLPAEIVLRSRPGQVLAGKVARIELLADSVTEERIALVSFDVPPVDISVGEMSEITLRLRAVREALVLPNAAVRLRGGTTGVWRRQGEQLGFISLKDAQEAQFLNDNDAIVAERARTAANPALNRPGVPGLLDAVTAAQTLSHSVNAVLVKLVAGYPAETVAQDIRRWKHLQAYTRVEMEEILIAKLIATSARQIGMFLVILTIVSAAIVAFIIYTMTLGKIREIAVLKLIGTRNRTIAGMILQQALSLGLIGFVVGKIAATIWAPASPK